ncbi:TIGR00266 family protein [Clostridium gasigenes]|uniref:TIGR00266 family protein n=1 Tax=Clostridium gasigenes TaxID=94869 RepID=UPI00143841A6|nr:TIGR00266 family protein [Clostridium gasigenes]MBU3108739.1 TIGR00266 family protein [Clostridium gasigenes]MBU3133318.1 TIGR00266 family protein [Clostridium gasigenes]MBU3137388.1 TIGR00266 family protein [Clostridium gasigenes]NKF07590.1 TIGR00266 family protein [Clostridium gasigenes]QSW18019.1 TIGR00266 family protein [Clostridium gasigenes]
MSEKFELLYGNTNKVLKIKAETGERYIVEAGAMVSMSDVFEMKAKTGGLGKTLGRMFSGESMFIQEFKAKSNGELLLAPQFLGDIEKVEMDGSKKYRLGKSSFLASTSGIDVNTKSGGVSGMFSGEGLIQMEASGKGELFISSYGAIHKKEIEPLEVYIVDSNHLVLWDSNMKYSVELASGLFGSIVGGEGFICKFSGPGTVWIQTRNPANMTNKAK